MFKRYRLILINFIFLITALLLSPEIGHTQDAYQYGTVIGSEDESDNVQSFLQENEEGIRVTLINSSGSMGGGIGRGGLGGAGGSGSGGRGGVQIFNVPKDTDYLELLVFNARLNPRHIRKNKIKIIRVKQTGPPPFLSEDIERYWTSYNFKKDYKEGGPFPTLEPHDIVIVQRKGFFNRPFFDPLTDVTFLVSLSSITLSIFAITNAF